MGHATLSASLAASYPRPRGPISSSLCDEIKDFECYDGTYTIDAPPTDAKTTRVVSIVGWGGSKKEGGRYWIARHSGGTHWDDQGFFRIRRGRNPMRIKGFCFRGYIFVCHSSL